MSIRQNASQRNSQIGSISAGFSLDETEMNNSFKWATWDPWILRFWTLSLKFLSSCSTRYEFSRIVILASSQLWSPFDSGSETKCTNVIKIETSLLSSSPKPSLEAMSLSSSGVIFKTAFESKSLPRSSSFMRTSLSATKDQSFDSYYFVGLGLWWTFSWTWVLCGDAFEAKLL